MKLLQVVWNFPDTVMRPFDMYYFYWPVREAVLRGWEAEVLTFQVHPDQPAEEVIDGIRVRRCPAGTRRGRPFSRAFISALLSTDADIIHCHGYGEMRSELAILLGRLRGKRVVFSPHFHVYPYPRRVRSLYDRTVGRSFFQRCDRVIVFTRFTRDHLCALGVNPERVQIVPHVARPDVFGESAIEPGGLLRAAGITGDPLILGVGQLIERKGWEWTVRCLPAIRERHPGTRLLIIGPSRPAEPAFRARLLALASDLGVSDAITIHQDNPPELILDAYRTATVLTHPSFVESFGMVLLEAMTSGIPVVAHHGTGIPCIVDDGATGYVVDVRDVPAYTAKLLAVLDDPALRTRMASEGRRQAATRFNQAEVADQLFALYDELTGRSLTRNMRTIPAPAQRSGQVSTR